MEKHDANAQVKGVSTGVSKWNSGVDLRSESEYLLDQN